MVMEIKMRREENISMLCVRSHIFELPKKPRVCCKRMQKFLRGTRKKIEKHMSLLGALYNITVRSHYA